MLSTAKGSNNLGCKTNNATQKGDILAGLEESRSRREELYIEFHQHPELSLQEEWTSQKIVDKLDEFGIENHRVGWWLSSKTVAMRGDIDALPVPEHSGKEYASKGKPRVWTRFPHHERAHCAEAVQ